MKFRREHSAFSLTEVLMAVGILSMGMMLIATMFPVGIYLTGVGVERTIASIVADEALAKIRLYGIADPYNNPASCYDYEQELVSAGKIDPIEFSYPSVDPVSTSNSQYYWTALYRKCNAVPTDTDYYITIFVTRKTGPNHMYPDPANLANSVNKPRLINIQINPLDPTVNANELLFDISSQATYVNPPTAIVDDATGKIYHVIDRKEISGNPVVTLERNWENAATGTDSIWLIPPPVSGGKNADVEVYPAGIVTF